MCFAVVGYMTRYRYRYFVVATLLLCAAASTFAQSSLSALEGLVGEWIDLRSQLTSERQTWERHAEQWEREIELLREEERLLDRHLEEARKFEADKQSRAADQLARKEMLKKSLVEVVHAVDRTAAELVEFLPCVPVSLRSADLEHALRELTTPDRATPTVRRLQLVLGALHEVEALQNQNHATRELLALEDGGRREMDVLYLGLARAFAVSADNSLAAIGIPSGTRWSWSIQPGIGPAVRQLLRVHQEETPPALVTLPIATSPGEGGQ
jgi:hypothetical protein